MASHEHVEADIRQYSPAGIRAKDGRYGLGQIRRTALKREDRATFRQSALKQMAVTHGMANAVIGAHNGLAISMKRFWITQVAFDILVIAYAVWRVF